MKLIKDLNIAIKNSNFYNNQFVNAAEKHILFVNPQLSGKHLYKMLFPFLGLYKENKILTALTGISKYNKKEQLTDINIPINRNQILWADFIVIPFTLQPLTLVSEIGLYQAIRKINNQCKIVYNIDFNFYEIPDKHPYKKLVTDKTIIDIENNIWFSDITMVTNTELMKYLLIKMNELINTRMKGLPPTAAISCMPFYIDKKIVLENIDYDLQKPTLIESEQEKNIKETAKQQRDNKIARADKKITVFFEDNKWIVNKIQKGEKLKKLKSYRTKVLAVNTAIKWTNNGFDVLIYKKDGTLAKSILKAIPKSKK